MTSLGNAPLVAEPSKEEQTVTSAKILLVDDDATVLAALSHTLQREGYDVLSARSGKEALSMLKEHKIALIICDQRMPEMSGLDILQNAQQIRPDAIRIALTGYSDRETVINAINIGHVYQFLSKPWEDIVLRQIVSAGLEKHRLIQENKGLHLQILEQNKELHKANQTLRYELQLAVRIHEELLLGKIPQNVPGMTAAAMTVSSKEVDGDFFDFYYSLPHIVDVVIGDVMGKSLPAALVGTALKTQLQRFAVPLGHVKYCDKTTFWVDDLFTPREILSHAHEEIARQLRELEFFVSLFYGRFDLRKKTFSYVDCGFTKPMHVKAKSGEVRLLRGEDFPLGMVDKNDYHEFEVAFEEGDYFIFYSNGVTESRSPAGELFGNDRLVEIIKNNAQASAEDLLQSIRKKIFEHTEKNRFDDDLTVLIVKLQATDHFKSLESLSAVYSNDLSHLNAVRSFVKRVCDQAPGDSLPLNQTMELAIDEAFCNIVKHAYKGMKGQVIYLKAQYQPEGLCLELSDQGVEFDPRNVPEPSLMGDEESGFGLFLLRKLSDQMAYIPKSSAEGWNHLRIYKRYFFKEVPMEFTHTTQGKVLIVTPTGPSLDAREAREFKEKVISLISQNETHSIVIDMQNLQFIDSSGLGTFLSILKTLHVHDGELKLCHLNKPIRTIFELVSMHKIFEIYNTAEEAIASFK